MYPLAKKHSTIAVLCAISIGRARARMPVPHSGRAHCTRMRMQSTASGISYNSMVPRTTRAGAFLPFFVSAVAITGSQVVNLFDHRPGSLRYPDLLLCTYSEERIEVHATQGGGGVWSAAYPTHKPYFYTLLYYQARP